MPRQFLVETARIGVARTLSGVTVDTSLGCACAQSEIPVYPRDRPVVLRVYVPPGPSGAVPHAFIVARHFVVSRGRRLRIACQCSRHLGPRFHVGAPFRYGRKRVVLGWHQFGANATIRGRWSAQLVGGAGAGANGGNVYAITVQIGSIVQSGPFAQPYTQSILQPTDVIGGSFITGASIGFGVGGGGLRFDDFGGLNQIIIDNTGTFGDAGYRMRVDPNFDPQGLSALPSLMPTYASVAADGSVGFATNFDVSSLWAGITDVSSLFNGNLAEYQVRGFNSSFFVEVVQVPAPGAMALLGVAGLAHRRRR
jgi:hypothetical protein